MNAAEILAEIVQLAPGQQSQTFTRGDLGTVVTRHDENVFIVHDWDNSVTPGTERYTTSALGTAEFIAEKVARWLAYYDEIARRKEASSARET